MHAGQGIREPVQEGSGKADGCFLDALGSCDRCFEKSLVKSMFYMLRDMGLIYGLYKLYPVYVAGNWPLTFLWWNATGFLMWALFVVGEFSPYSLREPVAMNLW